MLPVADHVDTAERYRRHAAEMSDSPVYRDWALRIADDPEVLAVLAELEPVKQQANLVFAAARWHGLAPGPYDGLRGLLLGPRRREVLATIRSRRTQTNEVRRLTTLVPALATLDVERVALVELGSSAGLCLLPDRFDYVWSGRGELRGSGGPVLTTATHGLVPVPAHHPQVTARIGVDLAPLDVRSDDDAAWLRTLVWPGQTERRERLDAALEVARAEPVQVLVGDMLERLDEALEQARGSGGVPVVHHSAAVAYLDAESRGRLVARLTQLVSRGDCHWISMEGERAVPELAATSTSRRPEGTALCVAVDARAVGWAHGHGAALSWSR